MDLLRKNKATTLPSSCVCVSETLMQFEKLKGNTPSKAVINRVKVDPTAVG